MTAAVDYSYARPSEVALRNAGYTVVLRYLGSPSDGRCITPAELRRLHGGGLMVGLIGQTTVSRPRGGFNAGREDGLRYNALADQLGAPGWLPIFYVCDVGSGFPAVSDYPAIAEYVRGILSVNGRPEGMYGPYPVLEMLRHVRRDGRGIVYWWQTAGASGSGIGTGGSIQTGDGSVRRLSSLACMFQHVGLTGGFGNQIDHNSVHMAPVTWAWHPDISPAPDPPVEDMDMPANIIRTRPGSTWAREVAGRAPGDEVADFIFWPSGAITWIRTPAQYEKAASVLGPHEELDDDWFYNGSYQAHDGRPKPVDATVLANQLRGAVVEVLEAAVEDIEVDAAVSPTAIEQIAVRSAEVAAARLAT